MTAIVLFTKTHPNAKMPARANPGDIGFDVFALEDIELTCGKAVKVPTGLKFKLPAGYGFKAHSRSGHGFKHGIRLANSTGIIDQGYEGELWIRLRKDDAGEHIIKAGEALCQLEVVKILDAEFVEISEDEFNETSSVRGAGGFGSTNAKPLRQERFFIDDGADVYVLKFDDAGMVKSVTLEYNPDYLSWYKPERIQSAFQQWFDGGCQQGGVVNVNVALENTPHFRIKLAHIS